MEWINIYLINLVPILDGAPASAIIAYSLVHQTSNDDFEGYEDCRAYFNNKALEGQTLRVKFVERYGAIKH